jgi:hypothetical protein
MSPIPENACLTPCEVVLLNGERFVPKGGMLDRHLLLGSEIPVSKRQLATTVYAAAFLGGFSYGGIQLHPVEKKAMLGLRTVQQLFVEAGSGQVTWPAPSLEGALWPLSQQLRNNRASHSVAAVTAAFLARDVPDPHDKAIDMVRDMLAQRGLVQRWEEKKMKIFTTVKYALPPETAALATAQAGGILSWLTQFQQSQPALWKLICDETAHGIKSRTEQTDNDSSSD